MELQKDYVEWTDIIDELRHNLNDAKKHPIDVDLNKYVPPDINICLLYTSPSPRDRTRSRMPSSA